jgi:hypothetical protein
MFYTTDADATRAFLRDKLRLRAHDVGDGWLIFDAPEADIGCHPSDKRFHAISFYCRDIEATVAGLRDRGVAFHSPVEDHGWGLVTTFEMPGAGTVQLYEPRYEKN